MTEDLDERPPFTTGLRILVRLTRPAARRMAVATALALASTLLEIAPYLLLFLAVESVISGDADTGSLLLLAGLSALASIARFWSWGKALLISHVAAFEVMHDLRIEIARKMATFPLGWFTRRRSGQIQRVLVEDVQRLEVLLAHAVPELVSAIAFWIVGASWLIVIDWRLGLAALALVPVAFFLMWLGMRDSTAYVRRITDAGDRLHGSGAEVIGRLDIVRLFDAGGGLTAPVRRAVRDAADSDVEWSERYAWQGTGFRVLMTADLVVVLPLGLWLFADGSVSLTDLLLVLLLAAGVHQPLERAYRLGFRLTWISYAGAVVDRVLGTASIPEPEVSAEPQGADIELRSVRFRHDAAAEPAVDGVSFVAPAGRVTALVGPSGAGKSTIARLIGRFWDVDEGAVLIGGVDVRDLRVDDLMAQVSVVFQDTFLFADSIAGNLRVARPGATHAELIAAAEAANVHHVIEALPDGYDTVLDEGGGGLSGGERQRLAIARAVLADTPVVVLDEATAFADPENELEIQEAIASLTRDRTLIVIAHRLRTVVDADQILVVDGGLVVEHGRHDELLAADGVYAGLWADTLAAESVDLGSAVRGGPSGEVRR
ncbi:MAG: ABC transporter ATP-binding protein [Actinomycetota bacterium]